MTARKRVHAALQGLASLGVDGPVLRRQQGDGGSRVEVEAWRLHPQGGEGPLLLESDCLLPRGCLSCPGPVSWLLMHGLLSHLGLSC